MPAGELTLGELNGELLTVKSNEDPSIVRFQSEGVLYPNVIVKEVPFIERSRIATTTRKPKYCHSISQFWMWWARHPTTRNRLFRYGQLISGTPKDAITTTSSETKEKRQQDNETSPFSVSMFVLRCLRSLFSKTPNEASLFNAMPLTLRIDPYAPLSSLAWHKYQQIFAVALRDDSIHIVDFNAMPPGVSPLSLWHEFQKDICCMEWKPFSGTTLAVGCRFGVCLWTIVKKKVQPLNPPKGTREMPVVSYRDHSAWLDYLQYDGHAPVNTLAWSPDGELLATGSVNMSQVLIWDVALNQATPLAEYTPFSGITHLKWSPNNRFLFAATTGNTFRVWETTRWTAEKWSNFNGYCQSVAWSADSSYLAIVIAGDSKIYFLHFAKTFGGHIVAVEDLSRYDVKFGEDFISVGGKIREIAWDPTGQRLAVSFLPSISTHSKTHKESPLNIQTEDPIMSDESVSTKDVEFLPDARATSSNQLIALFDVKTHSFLKLDAIGFVRGPPSGRSPIGLSFRPNFARGALLTVCWLNGKISFYPLYFENVTSR